LEAENGLDGEMREVVTREERALRAQLPLPGYGAIGARAAQGGGAVGVFLDANR
jgi:hypothetical protein